MGLAAVKMKAKKNPRSRIAIAFAIASAIGGVAACLDTTPIYVTEQAVTKNDAAPPPSDVDAALESGDAPVTLDCVACLTQPNSPGPGCANEVAVCDALPRCKESYICAVSSGCFASTSLQDFFDCGLVCANEAGVVSFQDVAIQDEYAIFQCALTACKSVCKFAKGS